MTATTLPASPWVVRGDGLAALGDAKTIRAAAQAQADAIRDQASRQAAAIHQRAHDEGFAEGARAAAALLHDAEAAIAAQRARDSTELLPLAFAIAHRILGAFDEDDRLLRAARTALDEHHGLSGLRLRVAPAAAEALRTALREAGETTVIVDADDAIAPGSGTLVHPRGRAAVGPIDQLRAIVAAQPDILRPGATS